MILVYNQKVKMVRQALRREGSVFVHTWYISWQYKERVQK